MLNPNKWQYRNVWLTYSKCAVRHWTCSEWILWQMMIMTHGLESRFRVLHIDLIINSATSLMTDCIFAKLLCVNHTFWHWINYISVSANIAAVIAVFLPQSCFAKNLAYRWVRGGFCSLSCNALKILAMTTAMFTETAITYFFHSQNSLQ